MSGFGLIDDAGKRRRRRGNRQSLEAAVRKGKSNSEMLASAINELSRFRYDGRLRVKLAAFLGAGKKLPPDEVNRRNTILNRHSDSEGSLGIMLVCEDAETERTLSVDARCVKRKDELSDRTWTTESDKRTECGMLDAHWIMAVMLDSSGRPFSYGLWPFRELREAGLAKPRNGKGRKTRVDINLRNVRLAGFREPASCNGFMECMSARMRERDVVACLLSAINDGKE